jgi:hypothetical protein
LEERFGDQIDEIIGHVQGSLTAVPNDSANGIKGQLEYSMEASVIVQADNTWDEDADAIYDEEVFDDTGAGNGVEGDLEMDED